MYKVILELKSGVIELYIDNIQKLGDIILQHEDDYTGCTVKTVKKVEESHGLKRS